MRDAIVRAMRTHPSIHAHLATVLLALAACGDSSVSDEAGGAPADGGGGEGEGGVVAGGGGGAGEGGAPVGCVDGPPQAEAACEACQNESCCITALGCAENAECVATLDCMVAGGDQSSCLGDHPDALWWFSGLDVCLHNHCSEECGYDPPMCGEIIPTPASCTEDVQAVCCEVTAACGENDACVGLIYQCIDERECASQACLDGCYEDYPDGVESFEALVECWSDVPCL
jgi:hypothetical protein